MRDGVRRILSAACGAAWCTCGAFVAFGAPAPDQPSPAKCDPNTDAKIIERHRNSDLYNFFDKKCNGHPDIAAYNKWLDAKAPLAEHDAERRRATNLPPLGLPTVATEVPKKSAWTSFFVLRDSYQDVTIFSQPNDASAASGASFGWSRDAIGSNTSWSAKGIAAYPVVWQNLDPPSTGPYLAGFSLSPAVNFQRVTDTNPKFASNDVDVLTYSGVAEAALSNIFDTTTLHFFRSRTSASGNFEGDVTSWSETLEYQPITGNPYLPKLSSPNSLGTLPATWELDAVARYQYLERTGTTLDPLFIRQRAVSRAGGFLTLTIAPLHGPASPVPKALQRLSFTTSYTWTENLVTHQPYPLYDAALGFALDDAGNLGVKLSYESGRIEETAKPVKLTKATLSAKY